MYLQKRNPFKKVARTIYSNPPSHGSDIVKTILSDEKLKSLWEINLNDAKNRIKFLKTNFEYLKEKDFFSKKNLEKIFYYNNKSSVIDLIDFELIKTNKMKKKLIELKNYFQKKEKPVFPIKAKSIMEKFDIKEGRELGQKLKNLENIWVNNSFSISDKEIEKTFSN